MAKENKRQNTKGGTGRHHQDGNLQRVHRPDDDVQAAAKQVRSITDDNLGFFSLDQLKEYLSVLENAGMPDTVDILKRYIILKEQQENGEIVVNQADQTADTNESVLTVNEGQLPEEEKTPSNFSNNDWLQTYYTEIRALLTDDDDEDENKVTQDEQGVHAELKSGMVLNFVNEDRVQVTTNEDPKADDFKKLVAIAKKHNKAIKLGDHMTDAFREALVVACAQEGVEIKNLPAECEELYKNNKAPEEVLDSLNDETPRVPETSTQQEKAVDQVNEQEEHVVPQAEAAVPPVAKAVATTPTVNELNEQSEAQVVEDKDTTIARLQAQVDNLTRKNESLLQELQFATDGALAATSNDEDQNSAIEAKSREIRELKDQIAQLQTQLAAQQQAEENADLLEINNLVAQLRNEVAESKAQLKQAQEDHQRTLDALVKKDDSITALREQLEAANKTIEELKNTPVPQVQTDAVEEAVAKPTVLNDPEAQTAFASVLQGVSQAAQAREANEVEGEKKEPETPATEAEAVVVQEPETPATEAEAVVVQESESPANEEENNGVPPVAPLAAQATAEGEGTGNGIVVDPDHLEVLHDDRPEDLGARPQASYEREVNYGGPGGGTGNGGDGNDGSGGNDSNKPSRWSRLKKWWHKYKNKVLLGGLVTLVLGGGAAAANLTGASDGKKQNKTEKVADAPKSNVTVTDSIAAAKADSLARAQAAQAQADSLAAAKAQPNVKPGVEPGDTVPTKWNSSMKITEERFNAIKGYADLHSDNYWSYKYKRAEKLSSKVGYTAEEIISCYDYDMAWTSRGTEDECNKHHSLIGTLKGTAFESVLTHWSLYFTPPTKDCDEKVDDIDPSMLPSIKALIDATTSKGAINIVKLANSEPFKGQGLLKHNKVDKDGNLVGTANVRMKGYNRTGCDDTQVELEVTAPRKAKLNRPAPKKVVRVQEEPQEEPRQDMPAVDVEKRVDYTINTPVKAPKEQISVNVGASSNSSINMNATDMSQRATDVANRTTSYEYTTTETTQPMNKKELSQAEKMARKAAAGGVISEEEFLRVKQELDQGR